jgi:hypothetical protein
MDQESNQRILAAAESALAQPFVGITTDGRVNDGLFSLRSTGQSMQPIKEAADAFLESLGTWAGPRVQFPVDAREWRQWANNTRPMLRHGVLLEDLTLAQRAAALAMLQASLSEHGFATVRGAMKLNETLAVITGNSDELGEWIYFLSLFGTPSLDQPWGWQLDGHHLIVNCFILGAQMVLTPSFVGAEPAIADRGPYAGTAVLQDEQRRALELIRSLTPAQRSRAVLFESVLAKDLPPGRVAGGDGRVLAGAYKDNLVLPYEGLRADALTIGQRGLLLQLIETYVGNARPDQAAVRFEEVRAYLDETYVSWMGRDGDDDVFYYKIHSPVILIELDHQSGVFLDNDEPARFHVHTVVRTPNGNDYGRDLLRQHYAGHHAPGANDRC